MSLELLQADKIRHAIEPQQLALLSSLEILDVIDSTNTHLLSAAKMGAPSGWVCLAEQQTKGRGRLERVWFSPHAANIYCSLLWRFESAQYPISGLSIAVAVMIVTALRKYGIMGGLQLKWPNDVLFDRRKLAGILLESHDQSAVVIGIGLNLHLPSDANPQWIDLASIAGHDVRRNYLTGLLVNELLKSVPIYEARGLAPFLKEWEQCDVLYNQPVTIHLPSQSIEGVMRGVNEQGELLLLDASGIIQTFAYGEVSVR